MNFLKRFFKLEKGSDIVEINREQPQEVIRTIRVFISYSTKDKHLAGNIKMGLERFGADVFLAHEDINPSSEWQDIILENLDSTDIFMPIITKNFPDSYWTDQESGIALAKGKLIVPISVDSNNPYGFINKFQAAKMKTDILASCNEIIEAIIKAKPKFAGYLLDSLIKSLQESYSFDNAGEIAKLIVNFQSMTKVQANKIFRAIVENNQVKGSRNARPHLEKIFLKFSHLAEKGIKVKLKEIIN